MSPNLYIIAGPKGAGKTTFATKFLPLDEIDRYVERGDDFGFETTLAGRSYLGLIRRLKKRGYQVHFFYVMVPTVDLALTRIRARVAGGGHDIPERVATVSDFLTVGSSFPSAQRPN